MKFFADMGIAQHTVAWLQEAGHDALHARDVEMQRAPDEDILAKARDEGRVLLTLDLDFGYLMAISGARLPSVIIFRLGNQTSEFVMSRLRDVLNCCEDDLLAGAIVSVEEATIRVRHLPIDKG
jgi:predicted nuclease of predicted toxin-antitoxin system